MSNLNDLVSVVMQKDYVSTDINSSVEEIAMIMDQENVGTVVITYDDEVEGIVTDRDIVTEVIARAKDPDLVGVSEIMTMNPETISQFATCAEAITKMADYGFKRLPVVDEDKKLTGVISISDLSAVLRSSNDYVEDLLCIVNGDARATRA